MNVFKKGLSALVIGGIAVGSYFGGNALVRDVRFAQAEEQVQASREDLKKVDDISSVYRAVGKAVEPSVVSIEVHKTVKGVHNGMNFDDDLFRRFFQQGPDGQMPNLPRGHRLPQNPQNPDDNNGDDNSDSMEQVAGGSGVIMEAADGKGYILTNNHVAGGAESMTITLMDGRKIHKAKVLGTDPKSDLAVVEIDADKLIPAKWGDSDNLEKGDVIFAFGSPFGYIGSMTHGIVSALNRQNIGIVGRPGGFSYENFIQVDAPINPGNSGGPLVNLHGEVVGINTAIATETGAFNGIGFAIPSDMAKPVYQQLKDKGKVIRGYIGVQIGSVNDDPDLAKSFGYEGNNGVLVVDTFPDTPATGKLEKGDIVTAINGKKVQDSNQLRSLVAATQPGKELTFTVFRKGKNQDVSIKIGEQPDELTLNRRGGSSREDNTESGTAETTAKTLGLHLATPNDELIQRFGLDSANNQGALVTSVDRHSPAETAGIQPGDIVTQVGDQDVSSAKEASDALAKQDLSKGIRLSITTRQGSRFVLLRQEGK